MRIKIVGSGHISATNPEEGQPDWVAYQAGKTSVRFDPALEMMAASLPVWKVSEMQDFLLDYGRFDHHDYSCRMAIYAAKQAVIQANWRQANFDIICGCSRGPTELWERYFTTFYEQDSLRPKTSPLTTLGSIGFALADFFGQTGLNTGQSVTCSSGLHAMVHAVALLRAGMSERVLVGGTEAPLTRFTASQMKAMRVVATSSKATTYPCQPLGPTPTGMVVGEGAALFCLSSEQGVDSDIELVGIGYAQEVHPSLSGISRRGEAIRTAMQMAIEAAGGRPDLIIPHAPGTKAGDRAEIAALQDVFGPGSIPPIYSGKWATGHTFGASGPLALSLALDILQRGQVPTLPYELSPEVRKWTENDALKTVMVNATGFGGNAVSVMVRLAR
ncbi:MAG: beta-ketoacyl synthase N-terminal-like domain-containing protein [Bacteroidota bacterium]